MEIREQSSISTTHSLTIAANDRSYVDRFQASESEVVSTSDYQAFVVGYNPATGRYLVQAGDSQTSASPVQNKTLGIGQEALYRKASGGSINWI